MQYGLHALDDKMISVDQFLDLNGEVGGYDVDGKIVSERSVASEDALRTVYAKGRISEGGGDQKIVPLIDLNVYTDSAGDIHDRFRAFSLRDRLQSPNFVIWTRGSAINSIGGVIGNIVSGGGGAGNDAIAVLDKWLDRRQDAGRCRRQLHRRERQGDRRPTTSMRMRGRAATTSRCTTTRVPPPARRVATTS